MQRAVGVASDNIDRDVPGEVDAEFRGVRPIIEAIGEAPFARKKKIGRRDGNVVGAVMRNIDGVIVSIRATPDARRLIECSE